MGANQAIEIDAWLRDGGVVVTASDRAARAIAADYHRDRLKEGRKAWTAPAVANWQSFAQAEWERRANDGRLILNPLQERAIWAEIVAASGYAAATLPESRHRLAAMAMDAHSLLCSYASGFLNKRARTGWTNDAAAFSQWLVAFDEACAAATALSASRVPLELVRMLERDSAPRANLMLAGFDRLTPSQNALFDAWGNYRQFEGANQNGRATFYAAADGDSELAACARWCNKRLNEQPDARLLVLTQDIALRRGEIERAFLESSGAERSAGFEFSLGVPLDDISIARSAFLLLHWLDRPLDEHQLDWLIGAGHLTASLDETLALQARMREIRRKGMQRTQWTLGAFLNQGVRATTPPAWELRMRATQRRMDSAAQRSPTPLEWAALVPQLLSEAGWPGPAGTSSAEFQAAQRLQKVVDLCASLGFDGRRMPWREFVSELDRAAAETLFAPESTDAPVLIAGPSESAGLTADAVWFLGASEDAWPARGALHPLLPPSLQRDAHMPHASPNLDWDLAYSITSRLRGSAQEITFSYARQVDGVDARPSRIVTQLAGPQEPLPAHLLPRPAPQPLTISVEDRGVIRLRAQATDEAESAFRIRGGSRVLTAQSQCAFKGFATGRLGAEDWDRAEAGLSPAVRGQLLHAAMHAIWAKPPNGIRTLDELRRIEDRRAFVSSHVGEAIKTRLPDSAREQMPHRYIELEGERLTRLVLGWLEYESARLPFTVLGTEVSTTVTIPGLVTMDLRLDRIDQLNDGSVLVIDYKTGEVSQKSWELPRPEDVQLPLYGGFALAPGQDLGGLVFAKIRAGDACFAGRVGDAEGTLGYGLANLSSLKKNSLELDHLLGWRNEIEQLARDYIAGRADVNPRDSRNTCARCGLQTLCRIHERPADARDDDEGGADE